MNKLMFQSVAFAALAFSLTVTSCGDNGTDTPVDTTPDVDTTGGFTTVTEDVVRVPSPSDIFEFMKTLGPTKGDGNLLNPTANEKKYTSKKAQAVNLGVYSADLLYASTFEVTDKVGGYFGICMRMGTTLQVATGLTEKDQERINKANGNADSLVAVGNDLYLATFSNLEANERGPELSLMLAGGWIESMYLSCAMVKDFEKDKDAANKIAEQDLSLHNLIEFMSKYESNEDVASVLQQVKELDDLFDAVGTTAKDAPKQDDKKRMVIGGGEQKNITKDQFDAIQKKIAEIRKGFVESN